jgi:rhamnose utilization protein RhaD (predicted bifunctional aldolase and dehydrogenase)
LSKHKVSGSDLSLNFRSTPSIRSYLSRSNLEDLAYRGTATPDHVIRIKPFSMIIDAEADSDSIELALKVFSSDYQAYFERNAQRASEKKVMLDLLPRSILVRGLGLYGLGTNEKSATIAGDLMEQTARIVNAAEDYNRFTPLAEDDLFDMEYWSLEQAKLGR